MKIIFVSFAIVLIDQISKIFIKGFSIPFLNINHQGMSAGEKISVVKNFLNITFVENPGIAFGIDFGINYKLLLSIFTLFATIALIYYLFKIRKKPLLLRLAISFILGGAAGNLIDRLFYGMIYNYAPLFYGRVVDFLNLNFFHLYVLNRTFGNYVLNIADISVSAGVILLLFSYKNDAVKNPLNTELIDNVSIENKGTF